MLIKNIKILDGEHTITLQATVQFNGQSPEIAYFSVNKQYESFIFNDATPFLAAFLIPCMKRKEEIIVQGQVSSFFLKNTKKIMTLLESWDQSLHSVNIIAQSNSTDSINPQATGCYFSGGVDSFYTLLNNITEISHLVFIYGFDVPLSNKILFTKMKNVLKEIAKEENKELIIVETNISDIILKYLIWEFGHGGALAGVGLFLRSGFKNIYSSSAVRMDEIFPYGTHPNLDYLWSTENMKFIHYGTERNRLDKILHTVAKSNTALSYLHVCTQNRKGQYNCSDCYKCLLTMIELTCANVLEKAKTFEHTLNLKKVANMYYDYSLFYNKQGEANLAYLKNHNLNPELQQAITESLLKSKRNSIIRIIFKKVARLDQKYNFRFFYRIIFRLNKKQDRNLIFKLLQKGGYLK